MSGAATAPPTASAIGWYGPLIDLSTAGSHIGDFVQLLVLVHPSTPIQCKLSKEGNVTRTNIHVGDDTRPFFSVVLWGKEMNSVVSPGDLILLQNVKITRFGNIVEARSVFCSSVHRLVHPYRSIFSMGMDELVESCRGGITLKQKLKKVIEWVRRRYSSTLPEKLQNPQNKAAPRNWKVQEEHIEHRCSSLSDLLHLAFTPSSIAIITASVSEILLPSSVHPEPDRERMFLSRRVKNRNEKLVEDIISPGCLLCGSLLTLDSVCKEKKSSSFYCEKSLNHLHLIGMIYRPFMLYVWDNSNHMPLLVKNKAAELLFGNITAEKVYQSYQHHQKHSQKGGREKDSIREEDENVASEMEQFQVKSNTCARLFSIWLVLVRMLILQGKNSPLKFQVSVNPSLQVEDGRFEIHSVTLPCPELKLIT